MPKLGQRIFAITMAAVFALTTVAFAGFVIYDISQSRKNQPAVEAQAGAEAKQAACSDTSARETLPVPEPYIAPSAVATLESTDLEAGDGAEAKTGDCLVMKYYGSLASNGTMFDENFTKPTAFAFQLGQGMVIEGWDKGLVGMKVGATRRLVIPAAQAYGDQARGEQIPANSDLVFVVKLLEIKK